MQWQGKLRIKNPTVNKVTKKVWHLLKNTENVIELKNSLKF